MSESFDTLIKAAEEAHFSGWDFSYLNNRWQENEPPWNYRVMVEGLIHTSHSLLDMGTGGGEFLASLDPLPANTCATEGYLPNVPIARERLSPLGVQVRVIQEDEIIPFEDERFDVIINRHESFLSKEIWRVLKPGGIFLTQQVGGKDNQQLNDFLAPEQPRTYQDFCLQTTEKHLLDQGFAILKKDEAFPEIKFFDIGAVVYYLKVISWQIEGFTVQTYLDRLRALHTQIVRDGYFYVNAHRFYLMALKPKAK